MPSAARGFPQKRVIRFFAQLGQQVHGTNGVQGHAYWQAESPLPHIFCPWRQNKKHHENTFARHP